MWKRPNEKLQASQNFWFSSNSQLFNGENRRENAIQKAILSKGLCYFLFQSAQCHRNAQRPPLWSQTVFQNKQNRGLQVKSRILMSKINFKTLWMRNYKRARISFTFQFLHFFMKTIQREDEIQKAVRSKKLGYFLVSSTPQKPSEITAGVPQQSMWKSPMWFPK